MLNRDIANNEVDIYDVENHKGLKAEIDTRVFTEDGRKEIKEDIKVSSKITDTIEKIVTTEDVGVEDFFSETNFGVKKYEALKEVLLNNPEVVDKINNPDLSDAEKQAYQNQIVDAVNQKLGKKIANDVKVISTDEPGQNGEQVKGFITTENKTIYSNEKNQDTAKDTLYSLGQEIAGSYQKSEGVDITTDREQHNVYQNMVAQDTIDDISFISNNNELNINLDTVNNHNTDTAQATATPSVFNSQTTNNNLEFAGLDKDKGDNYSVNDTSAYPAKVQQEMSTASQSKLLGTTKDGTYQIVSNFNPEDSSHEAVYYTAYNKETSNSIHMLPNEVDTFLANGGKYPDMNTFIENTSNAKSKGIMAVTNALSGESSFSDSASEVGKSWSMYMTTTEPLVDLAGGIGAGGVAAKTVKVEGSLIKNEVKMVDNVSAKNVAKDSNGNQVLIGHNENRIAPEDPTKPITSYSATGEERIYIGINANQDNPQINLKTGQAQNPGQFGATEPLISETQARETYAIPEKWKSEITHQQEYTIKQGTQIQESTVGSQTGSNGVTYNGGGNQIEILNQNGKRIQNDVLIPVGEPQPLPKE